MSRSEERIIESEVRIRGIGKIFGVLLLILIFSCLAQADSRSDPSNMLVIGGQDLIGMMAPASKPSVLDPTARIAAGKGLRKDLVSR